VFLLGQLVKTGVRQVCAILRKRTFFEKGKHRSPDLLKDLVPPCLGGDDMKLDGDYSVWLTI